MGADSVISNAQAAKPTQCHRELTERTPLITSDTETKCQHFKGVGNSSLNKMQQEWMDQAAAAVACRNATLDHTQ